MTIFCKEKLHFNLEVGENPNLIRNELKNKIG